MVLGIISVLIAYLLGSFPSAYLMARWRKGIDIREVDVRNMGGAAVIREVGLWEGSVVIICDGGKGAAAVAIAIALGVPYPWVLAAALAAFLGHNYPVYVGFRGGKGIATILGMYLVLAPLGTAVTLAIIGLILLFTRHIFSAVAIAAPFFLLSLWLVEGNFVLLYFSLGLVVFSFVSSRRRLSEVKTMTGRGLSGVRKALLRRGA
jgi:acyl phosphate:glycerol-3-phosphate acyltransferase